MTRLCGLNPMIDYTPVKWALRQTTPRGDPPRVRATTEAETTVTAYESLSEDDRAILLLLKGEAHYRFTDDSWTFRIDYKGQRYQFAWESGREWTLKAFIGYLFDHGHCPQFAHQPIPETKFQWREP